MYMIRAEKTRSRVCLFTFLWDKYKSSIAYHIDIYHVFIHEIQAK